MIKGCGIIAGIVTIAFAFLVVLGTLHPRSGGITTTDVGEFLKQRSALRHKMEVAGFKSNPYLLCAARKVDDQTVETTYEMLVYNRADLTTKSDREHAAENTLDSIAACGGDVQALARELKSDGDDLVLIGMVAAMLEAGR